MPHREQDGLPYRSPITPQTDPNPVTKDEEQYDTLKQVFGILEECTTGLYSDFNAFNIAVDKLPEERAKMLLHDVEIKQGVYEIVAPLLERVGNAISQADSNFRRRQKQ